jgi:hypothetical protein
MTARNWHIAQALDSVARLNKILPDLTEEEVLACLDLEVQSARRKSIIDRLISRAVRLNELKYTAELSKKYRASRASTTL